jgi:hypothetical protein
VSKHMYYWEDPAHKGWDAVVQAENESAARSIAKEKIALEVFPVDAALIQEALESRPTGIFHYDAALWIFTECDPIQSRVGPGTLEEISRQMRERASFGATAASLSRLLQTWADVLDSKPDVGWAARNRGDLANELERLSTPDKPGGAK